MSSGVRTQTGRAGGVGRGTRDRQLRVGTWPSHHPAHRRPAPRRLVFGGLGHLAVTRLAARVLSRWVAVRGGQARAAVWYLRGFRVLAGSYRLGVVGRVVVR